MSKRLGLALLLICFLALGVGAQEAGQLEPGKTIEREIAGGQEHAYPVKLAAGQFLRVVVEQKGIDVALALTGPNSKTLIESDVTGIIGAREPLSYEAKASGDYRLVVRANGVATLRGAYQMRLELKDVATEQDRQRLAAEQLL